MNLFKGCARCGQREFVHRAVVPPILGPPKARIMSISSKPWASLGAPSPADAHDAGACGAHHEVTAAGGSSIIEFDGPSKNLERVHVSQPFTS